MPVLIISKQWCSEAYQVFLSSASFSLWNPHRKTADIGDYLSKEDLTKLRLAHVDAEGLFNLLHGPTLSKLTSLARLEILWPEGTQMAIGSPSELNKSMKLSHGPPLSIHDKWMLQRAFKQLTESGYPLSYTSCSLSELLATLLRKEFTVVIQALCQALNHKTGCQDSWVTPILRFRAHNSLTSVPMSGSWTSKTRPLPCSTETAVSHGFIHCHISAERRCIAYFGSVRQGVADTDSRGPSNFAHVAGPGITRKPFSPAQRLSASSMIT